MKKKKKEHNKHQPGWFNQIDEDGTRGQKERKRHIGGAEGAGRGEGQRVSKKIKAIIGK